MLLREFESPIRIQLVAALGQLHSDVLDGSKRSDWTVDSLLEYLYNRGVDVDRSYLFKVIKKAPWSSYITNIKDDKVQWRGMKYDSSEESTPDKSEKNKKMVKSVASSAAKKSIKSK